MKFLVFAFLLAFMVSMIGADSSEEKYRRWEKYNWYRPYPQPYRQPFPQPYQPQYQPYSF
uniref:Statherin n=1 Tax=Callithrix jacchus TaxID=9483 RepID=A0A2R8MLM4_CALJA